MWLFEEGWHEDILCCKHTHTCTERRNMPLCLRSKHRISHEGPRFSGGKSASCRLAHRLEHSLSPAFQWWGRLVARDPPPACCQMDFHTATVWCQGRWPRTLSSAHGAGAVGTAIWAQVTTADRRATRWRWMLCLGDKKLLSPPAAHEKRAETEDKVGSK